MFTDKDDLKQHLGNSWYPRLGTQFQLEPLKGLMTFLKSQQDEGKTLAPMKSEIFQNFRSCPFSNVMAVVVGLDPHLHQADVVTGFKEGIIEDVYDGIKPSNMPTLMQYAEEGVLFLPTTYTWEKENPYSHMDKGWEKLTEYAVRTLNSHPRQLVFILLGDFTKQYLPFIDESYHTVLCVPHPAQVKSRDFGQTKIFTKTNNTLQKYYNKTINW